MKKSTISITTLLSFLVGIALQTKIDFLQTNLLLTIAGICFILLLIFNIQHSTLKIDSKFKIRNSKLLHAITLTLLITTFLSFGIYRATSTEHTATPQTVDYYNDTEQKVTIIGVIAEEPDIRRNKINYTIITESIKLPARTRLALEMEQIQDSRKELSTSKIQAEGFDASEIKETTSQKNSETSTSNNTPITGHLLISASKYPPRNFGDRIEIQGILQTPAQFDTFDYAAYLSRYGIYSVMYRPYIKESLVGANNHLPLQENQWEKSFYTYLLSTKKHFETAMNRTFPSEPSSSFLAGLLLGSRKGIPEQLSADFQTTGLTHIIAISGYNITIIVTLMMAMLAKLGQRLSIGISAVAIILFTLFVGASPAVVRACIMGLIALVALRSNRKGNITIALLLTATLMVGYNPKILLHDVGFQLSFLATMGLIYVSPIIEPYLKWIPEKFALRESIVLTLSAQIMALPVILLNFQKLSIISPLANLLVAGPIIPLAMLFGFLATLTSWIYLPIAKIIGFPSYLLLQYIVNMTQTIAKIPYASVDVTSFTKPFFIIYFIALTIYLIWYWKKKAPIVQISKLILNHRSLLKRHLKEKLLKIQISDLY
jgi:competence protein ComEC